MRDAFEALVEDRELAHLFPRRGQPAAAPWRLALVTVFQFAENLPDRQAADAVRARIDWKHALALPLTDPGFDHTVLSELRRRLVEGGAAEVPLESLLERFRQRGLLQARGRHRTDSTHALAAVRALNRLELVRETVRHALGARAERAPAWLHARARPEWVKRYRGRGDGFRLPKGTEAQRALAGEIGADGAVLLAAAHAPDAPPGPRAVPAVAVLRRVWVQNYVPSAAGLRWRTDADGLPPAARFVSSPHDRDARLAKRGPTCWIGYKVCVTETCEDDAPNLVTHVATTPAPTADGEVTPRVHRALRARDRLPRLHLVDSGFLDAEPLVASQRDLGVDLLGPTRRDDLWQARAADGFGLDRFAGDWARRRAVRPEGHERIEWRPRLDSRGSDSVHIRFSDADCGPCPSRPRCTGSTAKRPRRSIAVRPQPQYEALRHRRAFEATRAYAQEYARRAGIEGTVSQGVRRCGLRRSRHVGLARTHLGHVLTAAALHFARVAEWLAETPRAQTRPSPFALLMAAR